MDNYNVKRIFLASPGDLNRERKLFKKVVDEVNVLKAHSMGYHLEAMGWEETLPGKGRPQELINRDLVKADLFILLLWKRWGTPSGKYSSGTEEEFLLASQLNDSSEKPEIWLFFKDMNIDISQNAKDINIHKILEFRKKIEDEKKFLYKPFCRTGEWSEMIRESLCKWIDQLSIKNDKEIKTNINVIKDILIEITFTDRLHGNKKDEIYFTIIDDKSLNLWVKMSEEERKNYLFNMLSEYLYLNLGVSQYKAVLRYRISEFKFVLLGHVTFKYGATISESNFYIPKQLNQIITQYENEIAILSLHESFNI